jgi:polyisoprenoid-binding protein YceI
MKRLIAVLAIVSASLLNSPLARSADYIIDIEGMHAAIQFRIKHLGFSWLVGNFNEFDGHFSFNSDRPEQASVAVTINPASIDSNHAQRDKHLRGEDFLYVEKYPQASFTSTRVEASGADKLTIVGDLTLRGVTREITIDAEKIGAGPDPWGGFRMGFSGTTSLVLKDFGITKSLGPSATAVDLVLHVEGIKQDDTKSGSKR